MKLNRVILSGGGTGGHIFPAIAVANELKAKNPEIEILFVGALGKMEMEKVPAAGFNIIGLWISGLQRKLSLQNFALPLKLSKSLWDAYFILKKHKPELVVGFGGYASGPLLRVAIWLKIPTVIQEQNGFPGKTNKLLAKKVAKICVAYPGLEKYFAQEKIVFTGNPVRSEILHLQSDKTEAAAYFNLDPTKKTILLIGGSLGARTLNQSLNQGYKSFFEKDIQVIWQCGASYIAAHPELAEELRRDTKNTIQLHAFLPKMSLAYDMADVIISRAGAISVSELCIVKKPTILVPSPNVAEDHQTKNARILTDTSAAILVKDSDAHQQLISTAIELLEDETHCNKLAHNINQFAKPNATSDIVGVLMEVYANSLKK